MRKTSPYRILRVFHKILDERVPPGVWLTHLLPGLNSHLNIGISTAFLKPDWNMYSILVTTVKINWACILKICPVSPFEAVCDRALTNPTVSWFHLILIIHFLIERDGRTGRISPEVFLNEQNEVSYEKDGSKLVGGDTDFTIHFRWPPAGR